MSAVERMRDASRRGMQTALRDWSPEDPRFAATLFHRPVDGFVANAEENLGAARPARNHGAATSREKGAADLQSPQSG